MLAALEASGCELVTVALRRLDLDDPKKKTILDVIDWTRYRILPNTAGCRTAEEAIRIARLARSMGLSDWVKLEVIPDPRYLFPDPEETLKAARVLVGEGFKVLPYINADPVLAKQAGGAWHCNRDAARLPDRLRPGPADARADPDHHRGGTVPVVVDAGIGAPVDAALAMELGADAVLVNTAVALARDPALWRRRSGAGRGRPQGLPRRSHPKRWPRPAPARPPRASRDRADHAGRDGDRHQRGSRAARGRPATILQLRAPRAERPRAGGRSRPSWSRARRARARSARDATSRWRPARPESTCPSATSRSECARRLLGTAADRPLRPLAAKRPCEPSMTAPTS